MIILLARHGNTFNPGDRVYRVGKRNDLPLTKQGIIQAETLACELIKKNLTPCAVYCSQLKRTQEFAKTIISKMNLKLNPQIDARLDELDYGSWAGLTDEEIIKNHPVDFENWKTSSTWPQNSNWPETENEVIHSATSFARDITSKYADNSIVLVVSSAGKLRYFLKLVDNAFQERLQKGGIAIKTGNVCKLTHKNNYFEIESWNINPSEL